MLSATATDTNELIAYVAGDGQEPCAVCFTETDSIQTGTVLFFGWKTFGTGTEAA